MASNLDRRAFLERLGSYTACGAALSQLRNTRADACGPSPAVNPDAAAWTPPPVLANPNILVIMVDQMRFPMWLNSSQMSTLSQQYLPNIFGKLRNKSYNLQQYHVAATICTASRATFLSGLYTPQTAAYLNQEAAGTAAVLNPAFPTWAFALAALNPAYRSNCWWFGKWHLSNCNSSDPLQPYGFSTRTYPGGASQNPSPNGAPNEGTNGGAFGDRVCASDAQIAGDFAGWLQGQPPSEGQPSPPWCATVSLINPHDIGSAPAWLLSNPFPPVGVPIPGAYFPPPLLGPPDGPPAIYTTQPSPWNYENPQKATGKPSLHLAFRNSVNHLDGPVADWVTFLNQYYWLQNAVDQQVGAILTALEDSGQAGNTVILFTSDHGEYAGSHGLHGKGSTAYDESIRVPLYVNFPGQTSGMAMNQMCSSVDAFGLICDLATGGSGLWRQAYPDLASRQSIWSFLYQNARETRIGPALDIPYVLHTCDNATGITAKAHLICLKTKADTGNTDQQGAKLAIYSQWDSCTTIPNSTPPDYEFYDYNPLTTNNRRETGNDYSSSNQVTQNTIAQYLAELGTGGPPATGLIASELNAPLVGTGTDGYPLTQAQTTARQNYYDAISGAGTCTAEAAGKFAR